MTSLMSGSPRRETCTHSASCLSLPSALRMRTRLRLALAYTPITAVGSSGPLGVRWLRVS